MTRVRDLTAYEEVLWLADLPTQVTSFWDASSDDVLLPVDAVPSEAAPAIPGLFTGWGRGLRGADQ
jgi:hypothetical protein